MKKLNQFGLILSPIGILLILSLLWIYFLKPKTIDFIKSQIPTLNKAQDYVEVSVNNIDLSLLKLQFGFDQVEIKFKNNLEKIQPLSAKLIRMQVDPFKLLVGQLSVSKIQIDQLSWSLVEPKSSQEKNGEIAFDEVFKFLPQIPIDQIHLNNANIKYISSTKALDSDINVMQLIVHNKKNQMNFVVHKLQISSSQVRQSHISAEIEAVARLYELKKETHLDVSKLSVKALSSTLDVSGQLDELNKVLIQPKGFFKISSDIYFNDLRDIGLNFFPQKNRLPSITGSLTTTGEVSFKSKNDINGQVTLQTKQVSIDHFKLGQAQVNAEIKKNQIFINQIELEHPAGLSELNQIEIEQKPPYNFKAQLKLKTFDLQKLFISMGFNDIPAGLQAKGDSSCSGAFSPELKVNCHVSSQIQDVWVKPSLKDKLHIVKLKSAEINGDIQLSNQKFEYKTQLKVGQSIGSSQGEVIFADGFRLNFETEKLSFDDVESLADLNFKGDLKIKGFTKGDLSHGIIDADLSYSNAEIDSFRLGQLESKLKYEKAHLSVGPITGQIGATNYKASTFFNFSNATLTAKAQIENMHGQDLFQALNQKFSIPFELTGEGQATVDVTGPFDFWKLKYSLMAHLANGHIANENFEQLRFDLTANGDAINFNQVYLKKKKSTVQLNGSILTTQKEPVFALEVKAQPLYLEDADHILKLMPNLTGQTWIQGSIKGEFANPELFVNFNTKLLNFENADYPNSQGQMTLNKKFLNFNGQLFGRQIQTDVTWPWSETDPFSLRLQVRDLNPLLFLPLISLPQPSSEFYSRIEADVDLKSNQRNLNSATGFIKINDFMLQRGALYLKLHRASLLTFKSGLQQMTPIELNGESNKMQINLLSAKKEETKLSVSGDIQLKQFQFLTPFAQNLAGRLQIDSQVLFYNKENSFELFGDGEITDGLVSLKGFPQSIENINTPLEFSKSKIILSDISAQLGQSDVIGQGQIDIKGHHQINVNLQASADNIELTFPEGVTTAGKADLFFVGSWMPYTLKINYKVNHGLFEKDFGQDPNQNKTTLKPSPYLPPLQIEQQAPSLLLDVAIDLTQGLIVKNQFLEAEAFGKINVSGTPEHPVLAGAIDVKPGGKLIFKDKPFDIQLASVKFNGTADINPDIYLTANAHVSDYDVNLLIQGPAKSVAIKPTSQPPLSESDIFSLLALGLTSSKLDQNLSSKTQQEQTGLEIIASQVNQSDLNKKFQEKFGLTVQLAPTLDSTKNIAVPKVVVSKKIQKNLNASYARPLTGDTQNQEWKLQYLFNPNKSVILNYQNVETNQQDQLRNSNTNDQGILGLDFEYKKEFK